MSSSVPETHRRWSRSARAPRVLGFALLSAGLMAGLGAFAYAEPAAAGPMQVVGGRLAWGFTQTFQAESQDGRPSIAVGDGAVQERDGTIDFVSAGGSYDSASGAATMKYRGTVVLTYPAGTVTVTNPTVVIGKTGTALRADLDAEAGQAQDAAMATQRLTRADIGAMAMSSVVPQTAARTVTWSEVPTTLTATGATAFPYGFEGAFLGPMTFAATLAAPAEPDTNQVANAPQARSAPSPSLPAPNLSVPNLSVPSVAATTGTATPFVTLCPSPTPSTAAATSTPTMVSCPPSETPSSVSSSPPGPAAKLAKTGGPLAPLALLGAVLTVAGAGTMMVSARRRTATRLD